jgi:tetratricopeptide (TPR) repeat protein
MFRRKTILVGWDAADWKVIIPLVDAGKMPSLSKLINGGVCGNIATLQPVLSPMLWTSIATGKRPYKHGIHGFSEPDPVTGGIRPVTNLSRKTKAIWNIFNQNDLNTITVGWWPSNPAEPLSKGVMVSNDYQTATGPSLEKWPMKPGTIHPERLEEVLKELRFHPSELTQSELFPFLPGLKGMTQEELDKVAADPRIQTLSKIIADCTSIHSAATALMQNEPWDLMCVYYDAIDHFGHAFMKYHPPQRPQVDDWEFRLFNYITEAGYIYHDMMLGTLLDLAGDDATVMLISDHGFHPDDQRLAGIPREPAGPAAEHRQFGIFAAKGPGIKQDERIYGASLIDICPTLLHLFGLPVGEDMDGKVLLDIYEDEPTDIERIPTWDDIEGDHGMHSPDRQISAEDSKAALQQLVALGYIQEPGEDLTKAIDQTVRELDYNLAQAYIDGGIFTEAIVILERLHEKWPMEHRFGFKLSICYQSLGRTADLRKIVSVIIERRIAEADEAIAELNALNPDEEKRRFEKLSDKKKRQYSRQQQERVAKARPNLFALHYLEARADLAEKKYEDALTKVQQLDSEFGARQNALSLRGEILQRLHRWPESRQAFEEALKIDEESPAPLLGLARTALAERDYGAAIAYARKSIGLLYFQPRVHYILGLAHYRLGTMENAADAFHNCVSQAPLFSAGYRMLGQTARHLEKSPAEITYYDEQVKRSRQQLADLRSKKQTDLVQSREITPRGQMQAMPELRPSTAAMAAIPEEEIITIVSGLPRSGTSLMMQVLEAAGIQAYTDGKRSADDSNKKGYFEHDNVLSLMSSPDRTWITDAKGQSLKVVAPLLTALPQPGEKFKYRVLFMERDMDEILDSQTTMLRRLDRDQPKGEVSKVYLQQVRHAKTWLKAHGIHAMSVDFKDLVHNSDTQLQEIAQFLNAEDKLDAMQACIDPSLHRSRKEETALLA